MREVSKKFLLLLIAGAALAIGLAACGGSSSSSSSESSTTAEAPAPEESSGAKAPTGAPIVVGSICDCTGPFASDQGSIPGSVKAWEETVNAEGGINGHPVEVKLEDDEANPTKTAAAAKKLVQQDHVVAMAGAFSVAAAAYVPYLEEQKIPMIGGYASEASVSNSPIFFPSSANQATVQYLAAQEAVEAGKKKLAMLYCVESPQCEQISTAQEAFMKELGGSVVSSAKISATEPNFIAQCVAAKEAGAEAMYPVGGASTGVKVFEDCEQQGVEVTPLGVSSTAGNEFLPLPIAEGMIVTQFNLSVTDTSTEGGKYFRGSTEKYQPEVLTSEAFGPGNMLVWSGLQLFRAAAEKANFAPGMPPAELEKALYTFKNETLGGISPPLTFEKGKSKFVNCGFVEEISEEAFAPKEGAEPTCLSTAATATAQKAFGEL
jgi:branched-chain amino acid transport system substrate-binding protein